MTVMIFYRMKTCVKIKARIEGKKNVKETQGILIIGTNFWWLDAIPSCFYEVKGELMIIKKIMYKKKGKEESFIKILITSSWSCVNYWEWKSLQASF